MTQVRSPTRVSVDLPFRDNPADREQDVRTCHYLVTISEERSPDGAATSTHVAVKLAALAGHGGFFEVAEA